jgi:hypothetical protein
LLLWVWEALGGGGGGGGGGGWARYIELFEEMAMGWGWQPHWLQHSSATAI